MRIARRLVFLLFAFPALAAIAQGPSLEERLPEDTSFYILWRGNASLDPSRNVNSLLQLWADPQLGPLRDRLRQRLLETSLKQAEFANWKSDELREVSSLLDNPFVFGHAGAWEGIESGPVAAGDAKPARSGSFLLIDGSGKTELLTKLAQRLLTSGPEEKTVTRIESGGVKMEKIVETRSTHYQAIVGSFYLASDRLEVMQDLVERVRPSAPQPPALARTEAYKKVRQEIAGRPALEIYFRMPDLGHIKPIAQGKFDPGAFFRALHVEQIRTICAGVNFAERATHLQFSVLGDTSGGSIFDIAGPSSPTFATLAAAPAGASYNAGRIDFGALDQMVAKALAVSLPPEQAAKFGLLQGVFLSQLGRVLGGEYASIWTGGISHSGADFYVLSIRQPAELLQLMGMALAPFITHQTQEGGNTYLTLAGPAKDPKDTAERKPFYSVAVTPQMVVAGPEEALVREAIARLAAAGGAAPSGTLAADPQFVQARARLPKDLNGLSYSDLSRVDWGKLLTAFAEDLTKRGEMTETDKAKSMEWLKLIDPAAFSRHLHQTVSGSWKDRDGIHFNGYIE